MALLLLEKKNRPELWKLINQNVENHYLRYQTTTKEQMVDILKPKPTLPKIFIYPPQEGGRGKKAKKKRKRIIIKKRQKKKKQRTYHIHIVATYIFPGKGEDTVDIQVVRKDISKKNIKKKWRQIITKFENDSNGVINGETNHNFIKIESFDIVRAANINLRDVRMRATKLQYSLLGDLKNVNINDGECVIDYLDYEFSNNKYFSKFMTRNKIIELLGGVKNNGYTTVDIMKIINSSNYISMNALNPMLKVFEHHLAKNTSRINLCFIVNNNHCYPILDNDYKNKISRNKCLDLEELTNDEFNYKTCLYLNHISDISNDNKLDILINSNNLSNIANGIMRETNVIIEGMKFYKNKLISFQHPNKFRIESCTDYNEKKPLCKQLKIPFENQTFTNIGTNIFTSKFGELPKSKLSKEVEKIYSDYHIKPYIKLVNELYHGVSLLNDTDNIIEKGFDINKSYSSVLLENKTNYPIFTQFDEVEPYRKIKSGEYYIDKNFTLNPTIKLNRGWYPTNIINYCIEKGYLKEEDIKYCIKSTFSLSYDYFKKYVEFCFKFKSGKKLVNNLTGFLNKKYNIYQKGCISDSYEIACGTFMNEIQKNNECFINKVNDMFIIRSTTKTRCLESNSPIYRQIVAGGIINLDKLYRKVTDCNSVVISYKVDSIMVLNPKKNIILGNEIGDIRIEKWATVKNIKIIDPIPEYFHSDTYRDRDWIDIQLDELKGSYLVDGISGCGKSYLLSKLITEDDKVLCFTNKACNVLRRKGIKDVATFDKIFYNKINNKTCEKIGLKRLEKYKNIYVDEYSMVPFKYIQLLYSLKKDKNIRLFGDSNQCPPVEKNNKSGKLYDYKNSNFVKKICDYKLYNIPYKFEYGRYEEPLYNVILHLLKTNKIKINCKNKKIKPNLLFNIAYTNLHVQKINKKCCKDYGNFTAGEPIISNVNSTKYNVFRSSRFVIEKIINNMVSLKGCKIKIPLSYIKKYFDYGYCITVHRMQGDEITQEYNIYEVEKMSKALFYTALGRGKKLKNINFDYTNKIFREDRVNNESIVLHTK